MGLLSKGGDDQPTEPNLPATATAPTVHDEMYGHRRLRYLEMGFNEASAALLAATRAADGVWLWPGEAAKLIAAGATPEQAFDILR